MATFSLASLVAKINELLVSQPSLGSHEVKISTTNIEEVKLPLQLRKPTNHKEAESFFVVDLVSVLQKITQTVEDLEQYNSLARTPTNTRYTDISPDRTTPHDTKYERKFIPNYPFEVSIVQYPKPSEYNPTNASIHVQKLLKAISRAQFDFMKNCTIQELFSNLLKELLEATDSQYGFFGRMCTNTTKNSKFLHIFAFFDTTWDEETKNYHASNSKDGLAFNNLDSMIGYTAKTGNFCISNDPSTDPRGDGVPPGHPPLRYYLGCPLSKPKAKDGKTPDFIGMVGIANREGGYNDELVNGLLPLLHNCSGIIGRYEAQQENELLQKQLLHTNQDLERRIIARTAQLEQKNIALTQEIEQRKGVEIALEQAMNYKNEFFSTMSHELRCPIQAVVGIAELLSETVLTKTQRKYINIVRQNGANMTQLVNDVLDIGKLDSGKFQFTNNHFSLIECLNDVASTYCLGAFGKGLEFGCEYDPALFGVSVLSDSGRIKQILVNLISNAIKFTSSGFVHIISKVINQTNDNITFSCSICDSGVGISEAQVESLFQVFYQGHSNDKFRGTGIGLFLCKKLAESMNGLVKVESKIGFGSKFIVQFTLPCVSSAKFFSLTPFFKQPDKSKTKIAVLDPCDFTRKSLLNVLCSITQLPADNIVGFDLSEACTLFEKSFQDAVRLYDVVIVDQLFGEKFPNCFASCESKVVFVLKVATADNVKSFYDNYNHLLRPIVVDELLSLLHTVFSYKVYKSVPTVIDSNTPRLHPKKLVNGSKILVVDDSKTNRTILKKLAATIGCDAHVAESGEQALQFLRESARFDMVLMDMCMAPMDGLECARRWREYEENNSLPATFIVASTGNSSPEDVEQCLNAGMDDHLSKPITKAKLKYFM